MGDSTVKTSIIYLCGNGQTYCEFRKKSTKTANITRKAFLADEYLHEIQAHQDQSYFYYHAKCFHSFKVREEPHNLKLVLCIVSGEVEYADCGPICTAEKVRLL